VGRGISVMEGTEVASYFGDPNTRIPLGFGLLGKVAINREIVVLRNMTDADHEVVGVTWTRQERIRSLTIGPIVFKGEILGVLAGYLRRDFGENEDIQSWSSIFCDRVAAVMANAQAFEEIQRLKAQLELQNTYLQEEVIEAKAFGDLVGQSGVLRQLIKQIELVAPTEASVLILGETGTGKELVAHEIHRRSQRKQGPLVRVNCASIPRELFESELFGHVRGSFTGLSRIARAVLRLRKRARSSWTKSASSRWTCRASCCAFFRRRNMSESAMIARGTPMFASLALPTGI